MEEACSCIDRRRRLLSCASASTPSPHQVRQPRPGPRATTDRIDHHPPPGGEGGCCAVNVTLKTWHAARERASLPPSCYQTHRQRGRPRVNESGDLSLENHPSTRPPSPLRLYRVSISLSFSLVGERVQRPSRIHTPNPPFVASWCNASLSTASSSSSSSFGLYYIRVCVCVLARSCILPSLSLVWRLLYFGKYRIQG